MQNQEDEIGFATHSSTKHRDILFFEPALQQRFENEVLYGEFERESIFSRNSDRSRISNRSGQICDPVTGLPLAPDVSSEGNYSADKGLKIMNPVKMKEFDIQSQLKETRNRATFEIEHNG
jgi:hypothetical protein